ncbi:fimbrillin family protein [Sphingobacterium sp. SGR-19]|uniref:fimbrillin family protein n=1 Tax=Sphingobacterium sp. SGR-19 TaxID=2710886 RepID=UPI0013EA26E5|nr:fimbrillin family protein [Sphingobacterium sp. SGR-19]NGM65128.1 fimbrillin family protein [Sphingobacterium sp. SGR-19]
MILTSFLNLKLTTTILVTLTLFTLSSCSKTTETDTITHNNIKLNVQVLGITDMKTSQSVKSKASNSSLHTSQKPELISEKIVSCPSFDTQLSLRQENIDDGNSVVRSRMSGSRASSVKGSAAMENGITYRLLIYEEDGTFVSSTQLTADGPSEIAILGGETYSWYAVSYHNSDPIPEVDSNNPILDVPENTDLLYASGIIEAPTQTSEESLSLGIVFTHKYARIALELNTMGMFGNMNNVGLTISGAAGTKANINLKDGSLSNISADPATLSFNDFENVDPLYADRKIAYVYTAVESLMDLKVNINALDLELVNGTNRVFSNLAENPAVFEFSFTPQIGASYTATMNFIESFLTVNSTKFARTNLYYQGGHNPYRFLPTNEHTDARNTYFAFRGVLPGQYGNSLISGDPCALVYPEGTWRTPGFNNFMMIVPVYPIETYKVENGLGYFEYEDTQGTGAPYPSDKLRINFNGYGTAVTEVNGEIEIDLNDSYGKSANLWSTSSDGLGGLGVFYYNGASGLGDNINKEMIDYQGTGHVQTTFKNIRCIRVR